MSYTLQEQTIINHFEEYLNLIKNPYQQVKIIRELQDIAYSNVRKFRKKRASQYYQKRKVEVLAKRPEKQMIAKLTLSAGDIVKIEGARYGGMREVIDVIGTKVKCYLLVGENSTQNSNYYWNYYRTNATLKSYKRCNTTTLNDLSKVTHIVSNNEWYSFPSK